MRVSNSCDGCALRRVRCDTKRPCRECTSRSLECTFLRARKKRGPKGPRAATFHKVQQAQQQFEQQRRLWDCLDEAEGTSEQTASTPGSSPTSCREPAPGRLPIDVYCRYLRVFDERLCPIWPVVSTTELVGRLLADENDYEAWALAASLCAATIAQLRLPEHTASSDGCSSRDFAAESQHLRRRYDYRENCNTASVLTPFFLHVYYANADKLRTAGIYLRESIAFVHALGLDRLDLYDLMEGEERALMLRLFWLVFISERTYCAQNEYPTILEPIDELPPDEDGSDVTGAFASLTRVFAHLQGDIMGRPSRQGAVLDSCSVALSQSALRQDRHSHVLSEVQRVDLFVTQQWIRLLIWEYTMRHFKMSRESNDQAFSLLLPMAIARELLSLLCSVRMESICAHGYGMELKVYRAADALADLLACSPTTAHEHGMCFGLEGILCSLKDVLVGVGGPKSVFVDKVKGRMASSGLADRPWPYATMTLPTAYDYVERYEVADEVSSSSETFEGDDERLADIIIDGRDTPRPQTLRHPVLGSTMLLDDDDHHHHNNNNGPAMEQQQQQPSSSDGSGTEVGPEQHQVDKPRRRWTLRRWLDERFDWSWFTCTQSTGGIAVLLSECPKQFRGLQTIGTVVFVFNLAMLALFASLMLLRWATTPATLRRSFVAAPECFFYGSFWLSLATVLIGTQRFGVPHAGPWLVVALRVCFWLYAAVVLVSATVHFVVIFRCTPLTAIGIHPAWFLLFYNVMLTGTVASTIVDTQPPAQRLPIMVAGVAYQGFGWLGCMMLLTWLFGHLMEKGWPAASRTPGLFITVGSVGYTIVALIGLARAVPDEYGYFAAHPSAREVLLVLATWTSVFMWLFELWLFALGLLITLASGVAREDGRWKWQLSFNNTWWAMIFPNVGFTLSTVYLGQELQSEAVLWVSTIMTVLVVAAWLMNMVLMIKSVLVTFLRQPDDKLQ
ncbi:Neutral ceramidase [Purpureocillium lavendulum]|uniref:Neutral ceramidase n=1 Tax=Purpureocillium lavendulum TaxID=1247861 RepID=A0AB34FQV6_9HYPO|nr:Neutral ceramidase [Purpureocillium lavendulum]